MKLTTARPEYLPGLDYFWRLAQSSVLVFTDHFQYIKRSPITVSPPLSGFGSSLHIPVKHTGIPVPIVDKKVSVGSDWRVKHYKSLYHQFHLTPFGYYYLPRFEEIYRRKIELLSDFLIILLENMIDFFHLSLKVLRASQINYSADSNKTIIEWCHRNQISKYITSQEIVNKGWVNADMLKKSDIELNTFSSLPDYNILTSYNGFSAIGFLMQYGPEAGYILKQYLPQQ